MQSTVGVIEGDAGSWYKLLLDDRFCLANPLDNYFGDVDRCLYNEGGDINFT